MTETDEEFDPWCPDIGMEHDWSEWKIGPMFPREERFCSQCGGIETQEIRPGPAPVCRACGLPIFGGKGDYWHKDSGDMRGPDGHLAYPVLNDGSSQDSAEYVRGEPMVEGGPSRIGPGSVPHHERCDSLRCVCYRDGYDDGFAAGQQHAARHLLRVAEEIRKGANREP